MKKSPIEIYNARAALPDFCPLSDVPDYFIKSLLSAEDALFFEHRGINYSAVKRAVCDFLKGGTMSGGSSITQQLVKNLYFSFERSWLRKLKEAVLTKKFEHSLSKEQILELYINIVYFDNGQYGIFDASRFYFGKKPSELSLNQSLFLAFLLPVVGIYNPLYHPKEYAAFRKKKMIRLAKSGVLPEFMLREAEKHGADHLDDELRGATADTDRYDKLGPLINERFGPKMSDSLI